MPQKKETTRSARHSRSTGHLGLPGRWRAPPSSRCPRRPGYGTGARPDDRSAQDKTHNAIRDRQPTCRSPVTVLRSLRPSLASHGGGRPATAPTRGPPTLGSALRWSRLRPPSGRSTGPPPRATAASSAQQRWAPRSLSMGAYDRTTEGARRKAKGASRDQQQSCRSRGRSWGCRGAHHASVKPLRCAAVPAGRPWRAGLDPGSFSWAVG